MSTTVPQMQKKLRRAGFELVRSSSSHFTYASPTGARLTLAHHGKGTRFAGTTLRQIERDIAKQIAAGVVVQQAMRTNHPRASNSAKLCKVAENVGVSSRARVSSSAKRRKQMALNVAASSRGREQVA